ncbi:unnamed protein product, partial [Discosporangium mesarthrocarpum]
TTKPLNVKEAKGVREKTERLLLGEGWDARLAEVDRHMQSALAPIASAIIKACLPQGQEKPFPQNCFSLMVLTGAKGSTVNQSQVSCALGQQALEGRRVPLMVSGKSLPAFQSYESSPRANGFITDRFLTGIRPQEYYFHCMAGREGLVDTAVKTSRSGYLQRCLVKHLEELQACESFQVAYDGTVRDGEGCVHQFLYGEDGVDPTKTSYMSRHGMGFLAQNYHALNHQHSWSGGQQQGVLPADGVFNTDLAKAAHDSVSLAVKRAKEVDGCKLGVEKRSVVYDEGQTVLARRLKEDANGIWSTGEDLVPGWHRALVTKVLKGKRASLSLPRYNLRYEADGFTAKKVPSVISVSLRERKVNSSQTTKMDVEDNGEEDGEDEGHLPREGRMSRMAPLLRPYVPDPVLFTLNPSRDLGCVSEKFNETLDSFLLSPEASFLDEGRGSSVRMNGGDYKGVRGRGEMVGIGASATSKEGFRQLLWGKYMRSLAAPGEAVGSVAAQSVGEPSTQMTLNTFHLAGHGGANVTLGIPRLREIIMTASKTLKTPTMTVPLRDGVALEAGEALARKLTRLTLGEILHNKEGIVIREKIVKGDSGMWERHYTITLKLFPPALIRKAFDISFKKVCQTVSEQFVPKLLAAISNNLRKTGERVSQKNGRGVSVSKQGGGYEGHGMDDSEEEDEIQSRRKMEKKAKKTAKAEAEFESDDEYEDQGTLKFGKRKEQASYGDMDDDEKTIFNAMGGKQGGGGGGAFAGVEDDGEDGDGHPEGREEDEVEEGGGEEGEYKLPSLAAGEENSLFQGIERDRKAGEIILVVKLGASHRRLLMVGLVEEVAAKTMVRSHKGIDRAMVVEQAIDGRNKAVLQTEGCCFETLWKLKEGGEDGILDLNKLTSNHVHQVCATFGVEAARASIMSEVATVFGAYGIAVDPRHLSLIADHMTFLGGYRALNRGGMADFSSPCLQMSFETTANFMTDAAISGKTDPLVSPSARIVVGRVGKFGTGAFDLLVPPAEGGM